MKTNGGPAFPTAYADRNTFGDQIIMYEDGMTLREYYAGLAMQAYGMNTELTEEFLYKMEPLEILPWIAKLSVKQADAMIAELQRDDTDD